MEDNGSREYVLYLRKSKGRAGISRQRTVTTAHIQRLGGTITGEFTDTDKTAFQRVGGSRPEREDFDRMLARARQQPGLGIAAWHADRLIRNSGDTETLIEICAPGGNIIETPGGGSYDLSTASGRKRLRNDATDAAYEVDHAIERITAQKDEAAAAGEWLGGPVPFGWEKHPDGTLGLCPPEAEAIRAATQDVLGGLSVHAVARRWNAAGLRTRRSGNEWRPLEVRAVLLRARNAGRHVHRGQVTGVTGNWPAIVTGRQWDSLADLLCDASRRTSPGPGRRWLLSGIAVCGICGGPLVATTAGGKGRTSRPVYRCRATGVHVARDCLTLDRYVGRWVTAQLARSAAAGHLYADPPDTLIIETEIKAVSVQIKGLSRQASKRLITPEMLSDASGPLLAELAGLKKRLAALTRPSPVSMLRGADPREAWPDLDLGVQRAIVSAVLERVTVNPAPKGRPAGWQPGQPYFHAGSVDIEPRKARP